VTQESIFSDLKVVDLASYIAGPASTTILSDFGADVIKVEPPGTGDPYRFFYTTPPNPVCDRNYAWQLTNRNKRSICLDLKQPAAKEVLARLVKWADVLVTNFPPKVKQGLGLTYEQLSPLNPRLVYADITGYGASGPEADKPGFDVTAYWARTGLMQVTHDLHPHCLAPVWKLPVLEVLSAVHVLTDLSLGNGEVAYDYMATARAAQRSAAQR